MSYSNKLENNRWLDLFNASIFISDEIDIYKKSKLVVGIEKMPYKSFLEPLLGSLLMDFGGLWPHLGHSGTNFCACVCTAACQHNFWRNLVPQPPPEW